MFRENETSRVGAVLEARAAGDRDALVRAAVALWLSPRERADGPDVAVAEVWDAIVDMKVERDAIAALFELCRERRQIRESAFVHLSEQIADRDRLLELASLVLAAGWDAHPYLAAVFARLVEREYEPALEAFIARHHTALHVRLDTWILVGVTVTTSRVGNRHAVDAWFANWHERSGVPMWLVAAHMGSVAQLGPSGGAWRKLVAIARTARHAVRDDSVRVIESYLVIEALARGATSELVPRLEQATAALAGYLATPSVQQPIVVYLNRVKLRRPFRQEAFAIESSEVPLPDRRLYDLIRQLRGTSARAARVLRPFGELLQLERGDPRIEELCVKFVPKDLENFAMLVPVWHRLVRAKLKFFPWLRMKWRAGLRQDGQSWLPPR